MSGRTENKKNKKIFSGVSENRYFTRINHFCFLDVPSKRSVFNSRIQRTKIKLNWSTQCQEISQKQWNFGKTNQTAKFSYVFTLSLPCRLKVTNLQVIFIFLRKYSDWLKIVQQPIGGVGTDISLTSAWCQTDVSSDWLNLRIVPSDHILFPMFVPGDRFLFPRFVPGDTFLFPSFVPGDRFLFPRFVPGDTFLFPSFVPGDALNKSGII